MTAPLKALVLSGGYSKRMGRDKAAIEYGGVTQLERAVELARRLTPVVFVSVRADQKDDPLRSRFPQIVDRDADLGPAAGIRAAQQHDPDAAWLVLACDLPLLEETTLRLLIRQRDPARIATAFRSSHDGLPEPLCAIYEPAAAALLEREASQGHHCPRKFLINSDTLLLDQPDPCALDNVNTPEELQAARQIRIQYFALLREQAKRRDETVVTHAGTALQLFNELSARYHFTLPHDMLKVAINSEFADWGQPLKNGDVVVFIPPVAGG
jgi:molybdenum cofactor guanylyltransferase